MEKKRNIPTPGPGGNYSLPWVAGWCPSNTPTHTRPDRSSYYWLAGLVTMVGDVFKHKYKYTHPHYNQTTAYTPSDH
jgi:hypothetical protein